MFVHLLLKAVFYCPPVNMNGSVLVKEYLLQMAESSLVQKSVFTDFNKVFCML